MCTYTQNRRVKKMDKIKLILQLLAIAFGALSLGWFIGTIITLYISCGG
nr:MAG TPA: Porcine reproductive and respiratory syndrome virus 2b [Caudoviricetes sp.]